MKKFFAVLLMLPICLSAFLLSACNDNTDFWTPTYQKIEEFRNNENYYFITTDANLAYSEFVEGSALSTSLKNVYEPVYKNLAYEFNSLYQVFSLKPILLTEKNFKEIKQKFENLQTEISALSKSANKFLTAKQTFEQAVYENEDSSFAKQKTREFKKSFSTFIYSLENFNKAFNSAYQAGYQTLPQTKEQFETDKSVVSLATSYAVNALSICFVDLTMRAFEGEFNENSNTQLLNYANQLKAQTLSLETSFEKYSSWLEFKSVYDVEEQRFELALEKINLDQYHKNKEEYKQQNSSLIAYIETIDNFVEIAGKQLTQKTKELN